MSAEMAELWRDMVFSVCNSIENMRLQNASGCVAIKLVTPSGGAVYVETKDQPGKPTRPGRW